MWSQKLVLYSAIIYHARFLTTIPSRGDVTRQLKYHHILSYSHHPSKIQDAGSTGQCLKRKLIIWYQSDPIETWQCLVSLLSFRQWRPGRLPQ